MKVLVVGSGGREHAVVKKLAENPEIERIYCAPGNGGISVQATPVDIKATDVEGMVAFAKKEGIDFAVVTPDDPLVLGMADAMEEAGVPAFGPSKKAAQIEGSKVFAKNLMKKYGIPTAKYKVFDDPGKVVEYIERENCFPAVIKADGLALGKGVVIAKNLEEAKEAVHSIMEDKIFGKSGNQVVVEEFLTGKEVSVLAFTDSHTVSPMVSLSLIHIYRKPAPVFPCRSDPVQTTRRIRRCRKGCLRFEYGPHGLSSIPPPCIRQLHPRLRPYSCR